MGGMGQYSIPPIYLLNFGLISPAALRNAFAEGISQRGRFFVGRFLKGLRRKLFRKRPTI